MAEIYGKNVLEHLRNPRNAGTLRDANLLAYADDPVTGDRLLYLLKVEGDTVHDMKYLVEGCKVLTATSSVVTGLVIGKSLEAVLALDAATLADALGGLPEEKMHCPEMAAAALHAAVEEHLGGGAEQRDGERYSM